MSFARAISGTVAALRLLCVVVLLSLTVTPTLDGLVCAGEAAPSASTLIATSTHDAAGGDLDHAICAHGHGHCAPAIAPRSEITIANPAPPAKTRSWAVLAALTSAPTERLDRPPRA